MISRQRAISLAAGLLCLAASPAMAQYNLVPYNGVEYTDVVVNRVPQTLSQVRAFELRCQTQAIAGNWWMDANGNLGRMGGPATYNAQTCRSLVRSVSAPRNQSGARSGGSCHFFGTSGSICSW